jgi:hypothetical protein
MKFRILSLFIFVTVFLAACARPGGPGAPAETPGSSGPAPSEEPAVTPDLSQSDTSEDPAGGDTPDTGQSPSPLDPLPGEDQMTRGDVMIDSSEILVLESFPIQATLHLKGALPTPCHKLRAEVSEPDEQNRIQVEVYSLVEPGQVCIQVLEPFETNIPLGSFASGTYEVWVNGEKVGEINA